MTILYVLTWILFVVYYTWYLSSPYYRQYFFEKIRLIMKFNEKVNYKLDWALAKVFHVKIEDVKASWLVKIGIALIAFPEPLISDFIGGCLIIIAAILIKGRSLARIFKTCRL